MSISPQQSYGNPRWFAVRVKSRHEKVASMGLRGKGYEELLPLYRKQRRRGGSPRSGEALLPLFPGYLFCRFDPERRLPVLTTPGVLYVVGNGKDLVPVEDAEIEAVRRCVSAGEGAQPWPCLRPGQLVEVHDGPLSGLRGQLISVKGRDRLVVSVGLLQRAVAVEVDASCVAPATPPPAERRVPATAAPILGALAAEA